MPKDPKTEKPLRLRELKACIDRAVENAGDGDPEVEVWFRKSMYRIVRVGQFGIVPDVTITIGPKDCTLG
jgi:hypothetical protein